MGVGRGREEEKEEEERAMWVQGLEWRHLVAAPTLITVTHRTEIMSNVWKSYGTLVNELRHTYE
jgi:hypothetical protein